MKEANILRHGMYAVSLAVLLNRTVVMVAQYVKFGYLGNIVLFGVVGITALLLGLFEFKKSLSFGFALGGVWCAVQSIFYYQLHITDQLRFVLALLVLGIVCYALYLLHHKHYR